jgi:mannosyl-oligosaccharide alpha-1,2-mannosidase
LNDLQSVGIDFAKLGSEPLYSGTSNFYRKLQGYDLKKLHLWAAEGLAHTCWLTYADQKSGLGPEEVMMVTGFRGATTKRWWDPRMVQPRGGNPSESYLWIDALAKWKKSGSRGPVPGWMTGKPVVWTEEDRLAGRPNTRDYHVRKPGYLLRPEVRAQFLFPGCRGHRPLT